MKFDKHGRELPDPTPMSVPLGFKKPETLEQQVARLVRTRISEEARLNGQETFEEADDFDVEDDFDPYTPYEMVFDPILGREISPQMLRENEERIRQEYVEKVKDDPSNDRSIVNALRKAGRAVRDFVDPPTQIDLEDYLQPRPEPQSPHKAAGSGRASGGAGKQLDSDPT